jgi:ATP-dependent Clp protease ATP-binding subunit ClpC
VFERYTERARRALFFARYETSELGGVAVETEHLLLGLLRAAKGLSSGLFARAQVSFDSVRREIKMRTPAGEKVPTSLEIPFSPGTRRILQSAAAEAERLGHNYIGTEHLLLGMLCESDTAAAQVLLEKGIDLEMVRQEIARLSEPGSSAE